MFAPDDYQKIASHVKSKTIEEVEDYSKVFMKRMIELQDYERILKNIQNTAKQLEYKKLAPNLIHTKVQSCQNPEEEMKLQKTQKSKYFSPEADILLLIITDKYQYGEWTKIKGALRSHPKCRFDHLLISRNEQELQR